MSDVHPNQPPGLTPLDEPSDAELISAVRGGDLEAYGLLFARHVDSARRLARQLVSAGDVDDLVSDAFAKVLSALQKGGGPDLAFRAYLLTSLRRLHVDRLRAGARLTTTDDMAAYDPGVPFEDTAVSGFDNAAAAKAFASLPERWQQVLWHTEVEGQKPAEIAPLLGISANSVSALAYRAREGLRQAFISMHAQEATEDACAATRATMGAYLRGGTSKRDAAKVEEHLAGCRECSGIYLELAEVSNDLGAVLAPLVLGSAGAGYLAAAHAAALGAAKGGLLFFLGRTRDWVLHNPAGRATAGATGVVAAAVVVAAVAMAHNGSAPRATDHKPTPSQAPATSAPVNTPPASKPQPPATAPGTTHPAAPEPVTPVAPPVAPPTHPSTAKQTAPVIRTPLAPVAIASAGQPVTIDLTRGAVDPNGDPLRVQRATVASPSHGSVTIDGASARPIAGRTLTDVFRARAATGSGSRTSVTYTPDPGWRGTDTIDYVLTDGHGGTAKGTVKVTTPDAAPVANDDTANVTAGWLGGAPVTIAVLSNDTDANHDALTIASVTQPTRGHVAIAGDTVTYTPPVGVGRADDTFSYVVSDGHGKTASASVTVHLGALPDRAPVAHDDEADAQADWSTPPATSIDVLANDADPDGDTLTIASVGTPAHGTATIASGKLSYTPDAGYSGLDSLTYAVSDGRGMSDTASVLIHVGTLPDRAPVAHDASATTAADTPVTIDLSSHASDPDGDPLIFTITDQPAHGAVVLGPEGQATYTPDGGFDGQDAFGYTADDGRGGTASGTVQVTVEQPAADLALDSKPASVSGYEHIHLTTSGIPSGRSATAHIHITGITGWASSHTLGPDVSGCSLPDSPSGDLDLVCTVSGNGELLHLDFDVADGWSADVSVSPDDFTDTDTSNDTFHRDASTPLGQ